MSTARPRILILGGGFAGLESAFTLRARLGDRADLTLVSDVPEFLFKPNTIYIPFGRAPPRSSSRSQSPPPAATSAWSKRRWTRSTPTPAGCGPAGPSSTTTSS